MYIRLYVWMYKKKLTLSIDTDVLEEIKSLASRMDKSVSGLVEEYFRYLLVADWFEKLASELGMGELEPTTPDEIPKSRPKGMRAEEIVRKVRGNRVGATLDAHGQ